MSIFTLYLEDGNRQVVRGADPDKALILANYGAGTACSLAFWVEGDDDSHHWDHENETWLRKDNAVAKTNRVSSAVCMAAALQNCLGQMHRMKDMIDDYDGAIAWAISAGEAALDQFQSEIESAKAQ
jgi:hypothetical protein